MKDIQHRYIELYQVVDRISSSHNMYYVDYNVYVCYTYNMITTICSVLLKKGLYFIRQGVSGLKAPDKKYMPCRILHTCCQFS